jgi:RNA polymerase sigma-70 factor (ECF subfamily)
MLLSKADADDAAQEVFLKAFASLHKYTKDLSFSAWLYRIASNHCLDVLRKKKRQKTDSLDSLIEKRGEQEEDFLLGVPDPAEALDEKASKVALALKALSFLSVDQRQILILREVEGLHYEQICSVMGCSLDAVKARLRRARQKLQEEARHFSPENSFKQ